MLFRWHTSVIQTLIEVMMMLSLMFFITIIKMLQLVRLVWLPVQTKLHWELTKDNALTVVS